MWVWIMLGIGLVGLVTIVCWAVWLWHKATDVFSEIEMLGKRGEELAALLDRIEMPGSQVDNDRVLGTRV